MADPRTLGVLAVLAVTLLAPPSVSARIVPQTSIAGVSLLSSRAEVRALLGKPPGMRAGVVSRVEWHYPRVTVIFSHGDPGVLALATTSPLERTSGGLGVGSTEAELRRATAGLRCRTVVGFRSCVLREGRRVTAFHVRRDRVYKVTMGVLFD